ncbi:hypothetical protein AB0K34_10845 [Actinomadura sp. NPDC049382]|uniref:hypothetical protein n=1 Tax=Actinomadura sp. NPDC049382 TaxID=3158220 RepID=UPI0034402975
MAEVSGRDVEVISRAIANVWAIEVEGSAHERAADEAALNLRSGSGIAYHPSEPLEMLSQAMGIGYILAVKKVQEGRYSVEQQGRVAGTAYDRHAGAEAGMWSGAIEC